MASSVLPTPGGAEEEERAGRPVRIAHARAVAAYRPRDRRDGLVLPDDPGVQRLLQLHQPVVLALGQPGDGDAGAPGEHLGDVLGPYRHDALAPLPDARQLGLDLGDAPLEAARALEVLRGDGLVLLPPEPGALILAAGHLRRAAERPHPDAGARRVHQVDGLVGQEAVGEVAVGQLGRGGQRLVGEADLVVRLVGVAQAPEDPYRLRDARLGHQHRLEAALQCRVLLHVPAVLVQRGGADDVQLAAYQRRFEDGARVHGAFAAGPGADGGVQLVDEQDHRLLPRLHLVDDLLEPLLEIAPVLRAGDEPRQIQAHHPDVPEGAGHVPRDDALGDALDDGGLAHPRLTDQHRAVPGPPGEDLQRLLGLVGPAHDDVEPAGPRLLGEVPAVRVQGRGAARAAPARGRAVALRGGLGVPAQPFGVGALSGQEPRGGRVRVVEQGPEEVFRPDVGGPGST